MASVQENSITHKILLSLGEIAGDLAYFTFVHPPRSIQDGMYHFDRRMNARARTKGISQLKKRGFIKEYKKGDERYLTLTRKGKLEVARHALRARRLGSWDGKWRIIIFDIPEATRKDRNFLRKQLKWLGFFELQKSVWIFPYEIKVELQNFLKLCKVELNGDIRFLTAEHIDNDRDLRQYFHLV